MPGESTTASSPSIVGSATFKPSHEAASRAASVSSPHRSPRRPMRQRARGGQPVAAEADDGEALAAKMSGGNSSDFQRPEADQARIIATIQKRITMVGSDQPFFSK